MDARTIDMLWPFAMLLGVSVGLALLLVLNAELGRRLGRPHGTRSLAFRTDPEARFVKRPRPTQPS